MLRAASGHRAVAPRAPRLPTPSLILRRFADKPAGAPSSEPSDTPGATHPAAAAWSQFSRAAKTAGAPSAGRKTRSLRESPGYRKPLSGILFARPSQAPSSGASNAKDSVPRAGGNEQPGSHSGFRGNRDERRDTPRDRNREREGWSPRRDDRRDDYSPRFRSGEREGRSWERRGDRRDGGFGRDREQRPYYGGRFNDRRNDGGRSFSERRERFGGGRDDRGVSRFDERRPRRFEGRRGPPFDRRDERGSYRSDRGSYFDRKHDNRPDRRDDRSGGNWRGGRDNQRQRDDFRGPMRVTERRAPRREEEEEENDEDFDDEIDAGEAERVEGAKPDSAEKAVDQAKGGEDGGAQRDFKSGQAAEEKKFSKGAHKSGVAPAGKPPGSFGMKKEVKEQLLALRAGFVYTDEEVQALVKGTLKRDDELRQQDEAEAALKKESKPSRKEKKANKTEKGAEKAEDGEKFSADEIKRSLPTLLDIRRPNNDPDRYEHRPLLPREQATFDKFTLDPALVASLKKHGIVTATDIQQKSIPEILAGHDIILAAETGSGKTLAYGIPVLQFLLNKAKNRKTEDAPESPDAVVIVPSQELASQVSSVLRLYAANSSVKVTLLTRHEQLKLEGPASVLVCTPGALTSYDVKRLLSSTRLVVVDEADLLLSGSFGRPMSKVLENLKNEQDTYDKQFVFVAATIPTTGRKSILSWFQKKNRDLFGKTLYVSTDGLHKTLPSLNQRFDRAEDENAREGKLVAELKDKLKGQRCLIFCNTIEAADKLHARLAAESLPAHRIHKELTHVDRQTALDKFASSDGAILVSTDLAARGLDIQSVTQVVNYEFPRNVVDYIHRAGRTARAGATGAVLSYVLPTEKVLATFVEETYGQRLDAAFSVRRSFRRKIRKMADKEVGLPDKKLLKAAMREKRRQEKAKAEQGAAKDEEKDDDEEEEIDKEEAGDREADHAEEKSKK